MSLQSPQNGQPSSADSSRKGWLVTNHQENASAFAIFTDLRKAEAYLSELRRRANAMKASRAERFTRRSLMGSDDDGRRIHEVELDAPLEDLPGAWVAEVESDTGRLCGYRFDDTKLPSRPAEIVRRTDTDCGVGYGTTPYDAYYRARRAIDERREKIGLLSPQAGSPIEPRCPSL